jgi:hypothetical protein
MDTFESVSGEKPSQAERIQKMMRMSTAVWGTKKEEKAETDADIDGPPCVDFEQMLGDFECALKGVIRTPNDSVEFNMWLDQKLDEYRDRRRVNNRTPDSPAYKDALYKLIIGNTLRNNGHVVLDEVFSQLEKMAIDEGGDGNIVDQEIFWNAWNVIRHYSEGKIQRPKRKINFINTNER